MSNRPIVPRAGAPIVQILWMANHVARYQPAAFGAKGEAYGRVFRRFEGAGGPSPWITYRALVAPKRLGALT